jgi:hypothetical protein
MHLLSDSSEFGKAVARQPLVDLGPAESHIVFAQSFVFLGTLLQVGASDNERKDANIISEYVKSFCRKGPENRLFSKSGSSGEFGQKFWHLLLVCRGTLRARQVM